MKSWPIKKIGEVVEEIIGGGTPKRSKQEYWSGDIPWMTIEDINNNFYILKTRQFISKNGLVNSNAKLIPLNSVILSCTASVGNVAINKIPLTTNQQFNSFVCNKEIIPEFLAYILILKKNIIKRLGGVTTFPFISKSVISNLKILLPHLKTQKQIVERLDKIVEAQKLNDELIQKADELFQSLLHKELNPSGKGWEIKNLKDVAKIIMGQSPPSISYNESSNGLPFFQGKADFGNIYPNTVKYCSSPSRIAEPEDILISVRAPVGNINLTKEKSCIGRGLSAIRGDNKIIKQKFIYFFFKKNEKNWQKLSTGSTFSAITKDKLTNYKIPLPRLKIQKQIVEKLSAVQEYKKQLLEQKSKLKELFNSILHKSMKGEI